MKRLMVFVFLFPFYTSAWQGDLFYDALQKFCRWLHEGHASLAATSKTPPAPSAAGSSYQQNSSFTPPSPAVAPGRTYANYEALREFVLKEWIKTGKRFQKEWCPKSDDPLNDNCIQLLEEETDYFNLLTILQQNSVPQQVVDHARGILIHKIRSHENRLNKVLPFYRELQKTYRPAGVNIPGTTSDRKRQIEQIVSELKSLYDFYERIFRERVTSNLHQEYLNMIRK